MSLDTDDHDFKTVRKNLNVFSVLLLLLAFTNAQLNTFNFLGVNIELNGTDLYIGLYIMYLYFIWRFYTKMPLQNEFWSSFLEFYCSPYAGVGKNHGYERYKQALIEKSERLKYSIDNGDEFFKHVGNQYISKSDQLRNLTLVASFTGSGRPGKQDQDSFYVDLEISVSRMLVCRLFIRYCFAHDKFGDVIFPLVPVLGVLAFFFLKGEWQGNAGNESGCYQKIW